MLLLLGLFLFKDTLAQDERVINDMAKKHQACLDTGVDMLGCSVRYYHQMDSMLNVVYNNLRARVISKDKGVLKKEQLEWLKKRDRHFKKQDKIFEDNFKNGDWGSDMAMVTYHDKAEFVKARFLVLIKRGKKK